MRKPRIYCPKLSAPRYQSTNIKQIHHLAKVLRLKPNDPVELFDGQGSLANGTIQELSKACINFHVDDILHMQNPCLLYTSPSPRDLSTSRMPSSA